MDTVSYHTASSWTKIIHGYARYGQFQKALGTYNLMVEDGFEADMQTFLVLFKACASLSHLEEGKRLHFDARKKGITSNAFIGSSLLRMYGKCGSITYAENVFRELPNHGRDVVSWNAMLSVYADQGHDKKVLKLYRQMREAYVNPDHTTYAITIHACCSLLDRKGGDTIRKIGFLDIGKAIHSEAVRTKFASHVMVASALARFYGKCGSIIEAEHAFSCALRHNVMSWTSMFSAYIEQGVTERALKLFLQMHKEGVSPDAQSFAVILQACVAIAEREEETLVEGQNVKVLSMELGQAMHSDVKKKGFTSNIFIGSALLNMYAKCGNLSKAENVFNILSHPDTVAWTAMLSAYLDQGQGDKALQLYRRMQKHNLMIDETTLACVLQGCGESGRLDICQEVHFSVTSASYDSNPFLCTCLVHAYGISSSTLDANDVFDKIHEPDVISWNACISGYAREGDCETCLEMLQSMVMEGSILNQVTFLSILFVCSHGGMVDTAIVSIDAMRRDHAILPDTKHYIIFMDLLARIGDFTKVKDIMKKMQIQYNHQPLWSSLLGACIKHSNLELGTEIFNHAMQLQPQDYVLMSNIHANSSLDVA